MSRRSALLTRDVGSSVYWVQFGEDGRQVGLGSYVFRWMARRAVRRWLAGRLNLVREES